ncbi:hypothetical protein M5689_023988 [Euphorbia peplus]|nr:hypothetical protein M5689_023988 [Euphorbia peplus]
MVNPKSGGDKLPRIEENVAIKSQNKATYESDQTITPNARHDEGLNGGIDGARVDENFDIVISGEVLGACSVEAKAPKKVVSINERVEEIDTSKKRMRRKKSKENWSLFEKEEEHKPLKSILKVGSCSATRFGWNDIGVGRSMQ